MERRRIEEITHGPWKDGLLKRAPMEQRPIEEIIDNRSPMERRPIEEITGHPWRDGLLKRSPVTHGETAY